MTKVLNLMQLTFLCCISLNIYAIGKQEENDYHSYDPFRDKFLELRDNPPTKLANNPHPIPKIIHQFWIGPVPLPDPYKYTIESCRKLEGFEHKLWGNKEIESLLADSEEYKTTFNKIPSSDWAVKKDYLAYLALKKYGGTVVDASVMCMKNPQQLHENYSYYFYYPYSPGPENPSNHAYLLFATIMSSMKDGAVINNVINKFKHFVEHYGEYNKDYTKQPFAHVEGWHGWVGQVLINEAVNEYCFKNNKVCNDVYLLDLKEFNWNPGVKERVLFIDTDNIPLAWAIKGWYTQAANFSDMLGLK